MEVNIPWNGHVLLGVIKSIGNTVWNELAIELRDANTSELTYRLNIQGYLLRFSMKQRGHRIQVRDIVTGHVLLDVYVRGLIQHVKLSKSHPNIITKFGDDEIKTDNT
jgi:hypothetical protein